MDGTIYLDTTLFDGTLDFLKKVKSSGGRYLFVTNNSSKSVVDYIKKLDRLGIAATEDEFISSSQATSYYLKNTYPNARLYVCGTKSLKEELASEGFTVTEDAPTADVIVMGNDQELTFKKLEDVCRELLTREVPYVATNLDYVCPTEYGFVPDCGSVAEMLYRSTGKRPHFIGKPRPEMLTLAMEKFGYTKDETVMIGDRVYTDIAAGYNAGVDTIFVLSGEGTVADAEASYTKPTYTIENIREVYNIIKEK